MTFYKYRTINKYTVSMLLNSEFYFSMPEEFNDPFDSQVFPKIVIGDDRVKKYLDNNLSYAPTNHHIQLLKKQLSDGLNKPNVLSGIKEEMKKLKIFSMSTINDSSLMWAHYASSHHGICLGFDLNGMDYKPIEVAYKNEADFEYELQMELDKETGIHIDDVKNIAFESMRTKNKDWKYEKEWRLINRGEAFEKKYPSNALKEVIFGLSCSVDDKKLIMNILHNNDSISYYQVYKEERGFSLKIKSI